MLCRLIVSWACPRRCAVLVLVFGALLAANREASATTREVVDGVVRVMNGSSSARDRESRRAMALALNKYWMSFSDRLPRLSPSERAWVQGELDSGGRERLLAVLSRREGALHVLEQTVGSCLKTYGSLTLVNDPQHETYLWVQSLNCYVNESTTSSYLQIAGLWSGPQDRNFDISLFNYFANFTINRILSTLLQPR
jgi:hypothetical protein